MKSLQMFASILAVLLIMGCTRSQDSDQQVPEETSMEKPADDVVPSLDGKTFIVDFSEKGKTESTKDTLVFADGTFRSVGCDQYGFTAAPYTATEEGESVGFTASATSETEGEMDWTGTVSGDMIEGEVTWAKEGQDAIDYEFTGALQ